MGYGDSGAPAEGTVSPEARKEALGDMPGARSASQQFGGEEIEAPADSNLVAYVAAAEHANLEKLVKAGNPIAAPMSASGPTGVIPLMKREGDVWAKFVNGILVTDDPVVIKWCDENPSICRRESDPMTKGWATLNELSVQKANRDQLVDPSDMNADETFPPGVVGDDNLREQAAKPDSTGGQLVKSARLSREAAEQERARNS